MSGIFGGNTTIEAPDPIDIGQTIREYVGATSDPALRDMILQAERTDRPMFRALDLQDINTMAFGIQGGQANPEYARIQSEIAALEAGGEVAGAGTSEAQLDQYRIEAEALYPESNRKGGMDARSRKALEKARQDYIDKKSSGKQVQDTARAEKIASLKSRLSNTPQTLRGTAGLFDLQDEASRRAGATTREALGLQREDDIRALETLGGRVVDAQRAADPSSTNLARLASERAGDFSAQERDLEKSLQDSRNENDAFRSIQEKLRFANGKTNSAKFKDSLTDGEAYYLYQQGYISADRSPKKSFNPRDIAGEVSRSSKAISQSRAAIKRGVSPRQPDSLSRLGDVGERLLGSRVQSASAAERQLQQMGMTLGDLSPTEQEALISGRGTEFIQSTGELSPLEQRRAQQSSRQASLARGREMGQGSLYDEMLARQAEELNKQERQIALGSQLLGQEAGMRGARLGQGASMLTTSEGLAAQRRAEQLQRMQLGSGLIGQQEGLQAGRLNQAFNMNRSLSGDLGATILNRPSYATQLGSQTLGAAQQGAQQPVGPKLYDPNMGLNMAMMDQQNQFGLAGAQAQANATQSAGLFGLGAGFLGNPGLL